MRNFSSLALAALICAACATTSLAADQKVYCKGAKAVEIQRGNLSATGTDRQLALPDSAPFNEVKAIDDAATEALPTTWTELDQLGPLQMLCYSDEIAHTRLGAPQPIAPGTTSCSQDSKTDVVTCTSQPM